MKIKKLKDTYNDYQCELSFGQLLAVKNALAQDHSDPLSDELYAELEWYLGNIPGPGESEEDLKKAEEAGASGLGEPGAEGEPLDPEAAADEFLPQAPGEEGGEMPPTEGEELPPGKNLAEPGGEEAGGAGGPPKGAPAGPPMRGGSAGAEADRRVPRPEAA